MGLVFRKDSILCSGDTLREGLKDLIALPRLPGIFFELFRLNSMILAMAGEPVYLLTACSSLLAFTMFLLRRLV